MGSPDERHDRALLRFARWHACTADAPDEVRLSIDALARRIDAGQQDAPDRKAALDQLDELLMGEIARRHR